MIKCRGNPSGTTSTTTTTTTTTTACQPPSGYTYETTVDKYYKPVKDNVTWHSAKDACSLEGSILVEHRTLADYQAIRQVFGMIFNSHDVTINYLHISLTIETYFNFGKFWTGLRNPNRTICMNDGCINKLTWDSDGSTLDAWVDPNHGIRAQWGSKCFRYTNNSVNDYGCTGSTDNYYYICEFKC